MLKAMLVTCQFWCLKMHPQTPEDGHTDPHNWPKNRKMRKKRWKKVIHPWLEGWANGPRLANRGIVLNSGIGWALYSSVTLDLRPYHSFAALSTFHPTKLPTCLHNYRQCGHSQGFMELLWTIMHLYIIMRLLLSSSINTLQILSRSFT